MAEIVVAYVAIAYIVMAYIGMAYKVMGYMAMADSIFSIFKAINDACSLRRLFHIRPTAFMTLR